MSRAKISQIIKEIEDFAPIETAEDFDNVGLLVGSADREVDGVLTCLDVTPSAVKEAISKKCGLILSHHPLIFGEINRIHTDGYLGGMLEMLIKNEIAVYSAHTNLDKAQGGISDRMAEKLGLKNAKKLSEDGLGTYGELSPVRLEDFAATVKNVFDDETAVYVGNKDMTIKRVAIVGGAGGRDEELFFAAFEKADVFVSSEFKHNLLTEALETGKAVISISHYSGENICLEIFSDILNAKFGDLRVQDFPFENALKCAK